jgi:hypothetical protein
MSAEGLPTACGHAPVSAELDAAEESAFMHQLVRREPFDAQFAVGALYGRTVRQHADECHPDQVDQMRALMCPKPPLAPAVIDGWLHGFDWKPEP